MYKWSNMWKVQVHVLHVSKQFKKACQDLGILYDDKEFPSNHSSLSSDPDKFENVVWKRPGQICTNPKLLLEGPESGSVTQGQYGTSWFMAAASSLFSLKQAWQKVIPDYKGQEWDDKQPEKYKGNSKSSVKTTRKLFSFVNTFRFYFNWIITK